MGQEIVYCFKCATRLLGAEFDKGKAFRVGGKSICLACAKSHLDSLPPAERESLSAQMQDLQKKRSSSVSLPAIKTPPPFPPARPLGESSRKVRAARDEAPPPRKSNAGVAIGSAIVGLVVLLLVIAVASSGRTHLKPVATQPPVEETPLPPPPPPDYRPDPPPRPVPPPPRPDPPKPVDVAAALAELDREVAAQVAREEYGPAWRQLTAARARHFEDKWVREVDDRLRKLDADARRTFDPLREKAVQARRRGEAAAVKEATDRVMKWGHPTYIADLDRALAGAAPEPPPPPPPPPPASKDALAYQARLAKALDHALARDFDAAAREVEEGLKAAQEKEVKDQAAADLDAVKRMAGLHAALVQTLSKWPRGFNLEAACADETGRPVKIDEPVLRVEPFRLDVRRDRSARTVEFGEVLPASWPEIVRRWGAARNPEEDARAAAFAALAEGDAESARRLHAGPFPDAWLAHARKAAGPREGQARALWAAADSEYRSYPSRTAAIDSLRKLLADYADTAFARRNAASIRARTEGGREYFFGPADLSWSGLFLPSRHGERAGLTNQADVIDPNRKRANYVEAEFSAVTDAEYRAWIYAGACCLETLAFSVQASDYSAAEPRDPKTPVSYEPGGPFLWPVAPSVAFFRRTHASHGGGRKEPSRWEWIPVPLPSKFPSAGPKKIRVVSDQQGFTVSAVFVSALRRAAPRDAELREFERSRPSLGAGPGAGAGASGAVLREFWTGITDSKLPALTSHADFPSRPAGSSMLALFESPTAFGDNYGTRIRGYVHPPVTGNYTFWISSDDDSELYLSPNEDPARKTRICMNEGAVNPPRNFDTKPQQKSQPVPLVKGRRYYVEVLHKEGGGEDHVAAGWQLPDGTQERPIPGKRLSPWTGGGAVNPVEITSPAPGEAFPAPATVAIAADYFGTGAVARAELLLGSSKLAEAKTNPITATWSNVPAGFYPLAVRVTEKGGGTAMSAPVPVKVGEIAFYRGINLNGPPITIDGNAWEGRDAPACTRVGSGFELPEAELRPPADPDRAAMIRSSIFHRDGTAVTLTGVPPGSYQVYLYLWEDSETQTVDLAVRGKSVASGLATGTAGTWHRLGPWPAEVADGTLDVKASRGTANFSGIEVWRLGPK